MDKMIKNGNLGKESGKGIVSENLFIL